MRNLAFDIAHLLAGSMLVLSFVLLYQDRITATLNVFALQAAFLLKVPFNGGNAVKSDKVDC